jgi:hypothetical protein
LFFDQNTWSHNYDIWFRVAPKMMKKKKVFLKIFE